MAIHDISTIKPDTYFRSETKIDDMFILTIPPCPVTAEQLAALKQWGFTQIEGELAPSKPKPAAEFVAPEPKKTVNLEESEEVNLSEFGDFGDSEPSEPQKDIPEKFKTSEEVDMSDFTSDADSKPAEPDQKSSNPNQPPKFASRLEKFVEEREKQVSQQEEQEELNKVQARYDEFMMYINSVYSHYATHREFNQQDLNGKVLELCNFVREYKNYILRLSPNYESRNKNFIISHSMRSAVYAIVIGQQLKMPYEKLVELGVASILHEIGQIRLPPQLYMNNRPLTPSEKKMMTAHAVYGYNIIKEAGFPLNIQLAVLDHHERETGTGYPRKLTGNKISLYAKIIAVACSFEAITAPRQFKEERTTYEGMVEMLKNSNHLYDETVVKALLFSLSLFPVGAYVYLANGKIAQVVDVLPDNPKLPLVHIIGEKNEDNSVKKVQSNNDLLRIVRVLNKKETEDLKNSGMI